MDTDIAKTLNELTGQDFGTGKAQWQKWWSDEGKNLPGLK
jgi:hypothetical protein